MGELAVDASPREIFPVAKEEQLILHNRTAHRAAEAVVVEAGIRCESLDGLQRVDRVQVAIVQIFVHRAVDLISASLHDGVEDASRCATEFRAELVFEDRELCNGTVGQIETRGR